MKKLFAGSLLLILLAGCVYSRYIFVKMPSADMVKLRTAITSDEFVRGLSGINAPVDYQGMLFLQKYSGTVSFWMKGMKFSLDLVYLDKNKVVKEIYLDRQPCVEGQECPVVDSQTSDIRYIMELKSGSSEKYQIQVGSKIEW